MAHKAKSKSSKKMKGACGRYTKGQHYGALHSAWKGFTIGKVTHNKTLMRKMAGRINEQEVCLDKRQTKFRGI